MTREFPKNNENQIALPTVGRIVHYHHPDYFGVFPAIVVQVDGTHEILTAHVFLPDGLRIVNHLKYNPNTIENPGEVVECWEWMEYQKGQAAKTEALESLLRRNTPMGVGLRSSPNDLDELSKLQRSTPSLEDGKR